jgi:hypothetical protein
MTQVAMAIPSLGKPRPGLVPGLLALLIFILAFALFSPSLLYGLVRLDDITYVSNNTGVLGGLSASSVRQAFALDNASATMNMPLLWISYMLDVEWLGATPGHPWGFHFTNVLLHALNASLVFYLLYVFCGKPWRAFFFAALWAVHPLRVESVAWVTERKDVLSGFFGLLCIGAYLWAGRGKSPSADRSPSPFRLSILFRLLSLLFFALGLLVKPSLAPSPSFFCSSTFGPCAVLNGPSHPCGRPRRGSCSKKFHFSCWRGWPPTQRSWATTPSAGKSRCRFCCGFNPSP